MCKYWQAQFACIHPPQLLVDPCKSPLLDPHLPGDPIPLCRLARFPRRGTLMLTNACWRCWTVQAEQIVTLVEYHTALLDIKKKWTQEPLVTLLEGEGRKYGFVTRGGERWREGTDSDETVVDSEVEREGSGGSEREASVEKEEESWFDIKELYPDIMLCCSEEDIASGEAAKKCTRHPKVQKPLAPKLESTADEEYTTEDDEVSD